MLNFHQLIWQRPLLLSNLCAKWKLSNNFKSNHITMGVLGVEPMEPTKTTLRNIWVRQRFYMLSILGEQETSNLNLLYIVYIIFVTSICPNKIVLLIIILIKVKINVERPTLIKIIIKKEKWYGNKKVSILSQLIHKIINYNSHFYLTL